MSQPPKTLQLTPQQAKDLVREIASMCERAYRRGAQQAVGLKLSESDAAWYRRYGDTIRKGSSHFFPRSHAMPEARFISAETRRPIPPRTYSRRRWRPATALLEQELPSSHTGLSNLIRFVQEHGFDLDRGKPMAKPADTR